jgi:hypothetical protein
MSISLQGHPFPKDTEPSDVPKEQAEKIKAVETTGFKFVGWKTEDSPDEDDQYYHGIAILRKGSNTFMAVFPDGDSGLVRDEHAMESGENSEKIAYDVDEAVSAPPDEKKVDGLGMISFVGPKSKAKAKQTKNYGHITSAEDYIDALKKIGIDAQPTDWVVYFPESKGKLKTEDLNKIDKMLEKLGEEDEETGWDRFENAAQTWDQVIETGAGDPTEEEEKAIMDLGYYGAAINAKTIEGLKNGERYQESKFSLRSEFPGEGVNEKTFPSKDKLIAAAKEYSLGDKTGEHSWIDTGGVKWTVTGATVDEIFGKNSSAASTNKVDEMLASFKSPARKIPSKLREAEAIGRKDGLIDYLKSVVVIGGEGSIDLNDNKTLVQIAVVHDGSGYTPGAAIAVDQNRYHDLENDLLETCFEILKEEAMKDAAYIKELQKDYGDRWEEVLTETYDGKVWNLSVSDAVEAIKTNKYASKYIEIVEVEPQESKTLKSVDEMLAKLQKNEKADDKIREPGPGSYPGEGDPSTQWEVGETDLNFETLGKHIKDYADQLPEPALKELEKLLTFILNREADENTGGSVVCVSVDLRRGKVTYD